MTHRQRARLDDIFDTPSSPLAPPDGENPTSTPAGTPPSSHYPSSLLGTPTNQRRTAASSPYASATRSNRRNRGPSSRTIHGTEDFTQVGVLTARKLKLKPDSVLTLEDFAKVSPHILASPVTDNFDRLQAPLPR